MLMRRAVVLLGLLHQSTALISRGPSSVPPASLVRFLGDKTHRRIGWTSPAPPSTPSIRTSSAMASRPTFDAEWTPTGASGSLERLCSVSLRACQIMNPLISAVYRQLVTGEGSGVKKEKRDNSAFTIADGLVQRMLIHVLYSGIDFGGVVGEEEVDDDVIGDGPGEWWYQVEGLEVPPDLRPLLDTTKTDMLALARDLGSGDKSVYRKLTVFIDPIDGTREFSSGKGEQCSVCIGFANEQGKAVGGVVYRPLSRPKPSWASGAKSEGYAACDFGDAKSSSAIKRGGLLTTNGSISPFVESLIDELQVERVKSGGAGNKMMMLLENSVKNDDVDGSMLYIQDRGVSRWDTCAAEACLEAFGGKLMKLTHLVKSEDAKKHVVSGDSELYTYSATSTNLDFIPGSANLTKYNCRTSEKLQPGKTDDVELVKPYSNLCGLVAFGKEWNTEEGNKKIKEAINRAAHRDPPSFD